MRAYPISFERGQVQFKAKLAPGATVIWLFLTAFLPITGQAEPIQESGSLLEFIAGNEDSCDYDNWISHTSEADQVQTPGNFAPPELDLETNGFGDYGVVADLHGQGANDILTDWSAIFRALLQEDIQTADASLADSWFANDYEIVQLDDNGTEYLMLRELLNNNYSDDNNTVGEGDDVTGSFDLGWGLFVFNPTASNPQVIIEVVHPSTDYIAPYLAIDAFLTIDAGCLFINGASRNIAWSGGQYSSSTSLSDPSRNEDTPFHEAHKAAVDLINGEFVIQVHSCNAYPAHDGVNSVQLSAERENYTAHPNPPYMNWDHIDLISLTPDPAVPNSGSWPYPEVRVEEYYVASYPGGYRYQGYIPIPNNVDLPGTSTNNQMVYCHTGHDFINDGENWLHIEFDEFPDVVRLDNVVILDFYKYDPDSLVVPTYMNYADVVHYYRPVFTAVKDYFEYQLPQAASLQENASLVDFYFGTSQNTAYDNWVSHVSEGIADPGYNDYGPVELDSQKTGFGNFQLIPDDVGGDSLLDNWRQIFDALFQGDKQTVQSLLTDARLGNIYQLVTLSDGSDEYLILREVLNNYYFDDNGTGDGSDDVTGSFDYGWGLYVFNPNATCPEIVIEVVHPCDDYIALATALDAFQTIDAGLLFVNGAGREVTWNEVAPYYNSKSLSDPSRNERHPFQMAHEAAVDLIVGELVMQIHSFDTGSHVGSRSIELSVMDDNYPDMPLMDFVGYFDIISLTPEIPVLQNSIGEINHSEVTVKEYIGAYYDDFPRYQYRGYGDISFQIDNRIDLPGYGSSQQMLYSHANQDGHVHDVDNDLENWLHVEHDEFPDVIETETTVVDFYGAGSGVPTYQNFADVVDYYHPLYAAVQAYKTRCPLPRLKYMMVGIPVVVPDGDQATLFQDDFNNSDPGHPNWRVSRWNVVNSLYVRYGELEQQDQDLGDPADLAPGLGFWVIQNMVDNCILKIEPNQLTGIVDQTTRYSVAISPPLDENRGLTQIANPFHYSYDWRETHLLVDGQDYDIATAADSSWISGYAYTWNSSIGNYRPVNFTGVEEPYTIDTWQGFWLEQLDDSKDIEVLFTPLSMQGGQQFNAPGRDGSTGEDQDEWTLKLTLGTTDGDYRDENNIVGVNHHSQDDYDFLDAIEFTPMASNYVQLYFPHPEWPIMAEEFTYDYRSVEFGVMKQWDFTVRIVNLPGRELVLGWPNIGEISNECSYVLEDVDRGVEAADLRVSGSYVFRSNSSNREERHFRLSVDKSGSGIIVGEFGIITAYPNPFNNRLRVIFNLPASQDVMLNLFDVQGRRVKVMIDGFLEVGTHEALLSSDHLASGLYFVRLETADKVATQKVLLLR